MPTLITGTLAADVEPSTGDILVNFQGTSTKPYGVQFRRGCVAKLVTVLRGLMQASHAKFGGSPDTQPSVLTGTQRFRHPDGRRGIVFTLDHGLPMAVLMDETSVEALQKELEQLKDTGTLPSTSGTAH